MFGFRSKKQKLVDKYEKMLKDAYELSHYDRKRSDMVAAEAEVLRLQIDSMEIKDTSQHDVDNQHSN